MNKKDYTTKVQEVAEAMFEKSDEICAFDIHEILPEYSIMSIRKGLASMACRGEAFATYKWIRKNGTRVTTYTKQPTRKFQARGKRKGLPEILNYCYPYI